jgi:heme A synthase
MVQLHATLGIVVMAAALLFVVLAAASAWLLQRGYAQIDRLRLIMEGLLIVQVVVGAIVFISGSRPGEWLHLVYGIAILAALPLAASFASEAPPRPRTGVFAVGGLVILLLAWRLLSTG